MATVNEINSQLCRAFGLDPSKVRRIVLTIDPNDLPKLEVTMINLEKRAFDKVVKRYRLVDDVVEVTNLASRAREYAPAGKFDGGEQ